MRCHWVAQLFLLNTIVAAGVAQAAAITVINPSFETFNPLTSACGGGAVNCFFNLSGVPGWTSSGGVTGSWQPGVLPNFLFNFIPDGITTAYAQNGSSLSQTVTETAVAGVTYTLLVEIGNRKDQAAAGSAQLVVGSNTINALGGPIAEGGWSTFTATYTAQAADAGQAIRIQLNSNAVQGNFDNVRLSSDAVPEPGTVAMMGAGLAVVALARRRRR